MITLQICCASMMIINNFKFRNFYCVANNSSLMINRNRYFNKLGVSVSSINLIHTKFNNIFNTKILNIMMKYNNNIINEIENDLPKLILLIELIKDGIAKHSLVEIYHEIFEKYKKLGINKKDLLNILNEYSDTMIYKDVDINCCENIKHHIDMIVEFVGKKNVVLSIFLALSKVNYYYAAINSCLRQQNISCENKWRGDKGPVEYLYVDKPILFDASCSGIQHIASLTLEKEMAKNVNVYTDSSNPKSDYPQDFYVYALNKIIDRISESGIEGLSDVKLNRKMIKKSVMTIPYNISLTGVGDQLMEHFEVYWLLNYKHIKLPANATHSGKELFLTPSEFGQLTKIVYFVLTKELPSLRSLSDYFNSMIDIFIKLNLPVTWITPAGLKISYINIKFESRKVKAKLLKTSKMATIKLPTDSVDNLTMKRSFMPNFIHSLDAANIHLLLLAMFHKSLPVYTIHDCFACTPNNMMTMDKLVKNAFIDIYFNEEGYLLKLHKHFVATILSATDSYQPIGLSEFGEVTSSSNIKDKNKDLDKISLTSLQKVIDRVSKEIITIPSLPLGYMSKNAELNEFICPGQGLLKSKYFIG